MRTFILRLRSSSGAPDAETIAGHVEDVVTGRVATVRDDDLVATVRSWLADDEAPGG